MINTDSQPMTTATEALAAARAELDTVRRDLATRLVATFPTADDRRRFALHLFDDITTDEDGDMRRSFECDFVDLVYRVCDTDRPGTSDPFDTVPVGVTVDNVFVPTYDHPSLGDGYIRVTLTWTGEGARRVWALDRIVESFDSSMDDQEGFVKWIEALVTVETDR